MPRNFQQLIDKLWLPVLVVMVVFTPLLVVRTAKRKK